MSSNILAERAAGCERTVNLARALLASAESCDDDGHFIMPRRSRLTPPSPPQTPVELAPGRALPHEHWSSQLVHTLPNDYVLTTLGGSSSCYKHGYGE